MAGTYVLDVAASSVCTMLPEALRSRTFAATIRQPARVPPESFFSVGGPTVVEGWNGASVGVAGGRVAVPFETLVEQVAPNVFLSFSGLAEASNVTPDASMFALAFEGTITYCVTTAANGRFEDCFEGRTSTLSACDRNPRLILTRR